MAYINAEEEYYADDPGLDALPEPPAWEPDEEELDVMFAYEDSDEEEEPLGEGFLVADPDGENEAFPESPAPVSDKRKRGEAFPVTETKKHNGAVYVFGEIPRPEGAYSPAPQLRRISKKKFPCTGTIKELALAVYDSLPLANRDGQRAMLEYMAEGMDEARVNRAGLADDAANGVEIDSGILPYRIGAAEAPVGTGKSYVLLILAFCSWYLYGRRTVISTYTKVLQNQLYTKDLPNLVRMLKDVSAKKGIVDAERVSKWRFGVVKGKSNYMCPLILNKYKNTVAKSGDLVYKLPWADSGTVLISSAKLMAIEQSVMGIRDLDRTGTIFEDDPMYPLLRASSYNCDRAKAANGGECPYMKAKCPYLQARRIANDLIIVNHKLLEYMLENDSQGAVQDKDKDEPDTDGKASRKAKFKTDLSKESNILLAENYIFDEAHHLMGYSAGVPDISEDSLYSEDLMSAMTVPVPSYMSSESRTALFAAREAVWNLWNRTLEAIQDDLDKVRSGTAKPSEMAFFNKEKKRVLYEEIRKATEELFSLSGHTEDLSAAAAETQSFWQKFVNAVETGMLNVKDKTDVSSEGIEFTVYKERSFEEDMAKNAPYMEYLGFVSGTLFVGNSAKTFELETGITGLRKGITVPSPYRHSMISLWLPDKHKNDAETPRMINMKKHTKGVIDFCRQYVPPYIKEDLGGVLILCTSVKRMNAVAEALRPYIEQAGKTLLVQGTQTRSKLVRSFMSSSSPVLVACDSFREGFDAPEEKLTWVIIDKLPFQNPGSNSFQARLQMLMKRSAYVNERVHSINLMLVALAQSVGRLERSEYDWGTLTILDPRINWFFKEKKKASPDTLSRKKSISELAEYIDVDIRKVIQTPGTEIRTISGSITTENWIRYSKKLRLDAECAKYSL